MESQNRSCCELQLDAGKILERKPLTELFVDGTFTEDREAWKKELQRHCDEVRGDDRGRREEN